MRPTRAPLAAMKRTVRLSKGNAKTTGKLGGPAVDAEDAMGGGDAVSLRPPSPPPELMLAAAVEAIAAAWAVDWAVEAAKAPHRRETARRLITASVRTVKTGARWLRRSQRRQVRSVPALTM